MYAKCKIRGIVMLLLELGCFLHHWPGCSASARTRSDVFAPCPGPGPGRPVTEKPPGLRQRGGHGAGEPWLARGNTTGEEERESDAK